MGHREQEKRVMGHRRRRSDGGPSDGAPHRRPYVGYPSLVLGAIASFLEPFRGRLSPNIDNVSEKLTLRYPHEGPWVDRVGGCLGCPRCERQGVRHTFACRGSRWSSNPSGKCSYERPTRGTVCGTMRSMCGADAGCLAINYQSLFACRGTSLMGNSAPLAPYSRTMPGALRWSWGGGLFLMSDAPL